MALDRRKNDFDVMERVLGSVRDEEFASHADVVTLDLRPGMITASASAVQVSVIGRGDADAHRRDRHDR